MQPFDTHDAARFAARLGAALPTLILPFALAACAVGPGFDTGGWKVLNERSFDAIVPGMPASEVLAQLGEPARVFNVGWQRLQVWNYRFSGADCVWYQVSIGQESQRVTEAGMGYDPKCDGPGGGRQ